MFISDWETFFTEIAESRIFNIRIPKVFTPYDWEKKFSDENTHEDLGDFKIVSSTELPNGDILIGCKKVYVAEIPEYNGNGFEEYLELSAAIRFFKLSEIQFADVTETEEYSFLQSDNCQIHVFKPKGDNDE